MARNGDVEAMIGYLAPESRINRFFWAADGGRLSTSRTVAHRVTIRNARMADPPFTLDRNGFTLVRALTALAGIHDRAAIDGPYTREMETLARTLTGADLVLPMGAEVRSSHPDGGRVQPPAVRAHIDYDGPTARRIALRRYRRARPDGPEPARAMLLSLWRCVSPPPQDWPLALCDFASCARDEEVRIVKIDVAHLPEGAARFAPIAGEDRRGASGLFRFNPAHRWFHYPDMTRDEVIAIKFHDSDHGRAWRAPHCAFHDESRPDANPRESIEFRVAVYFLQNEGCQTGEDR